MSENTTNPDGSPGGPPSDHGASLPHDRDEQPVPDGANAAHPVNGRTADQAHHDAESKVVDTERIGTPNDVPTAADNAR